MKLLIIDDLKTLVGTLVGIFGQQYEAVAGHCKSVSGAMRLIKRYNPDVVLLDIQLGKGGREGVEVARRLQAAGFQGKIIAHSSFKREEQEAWLRSFGVQHFARKGKIAEIRACIEGACNCLPNKVEKAGTFCGLSHDERLGLAYDPLMSLQTALLQLEVLAEKYPDLKGWHQELFDYTERLRDELIGD
jgi:CheY-like chemotaxis protein